MIEQLSDLIKCIQKHDGIADKAKLTETIKAEFALTKDRSVFYNTHFAIRFSSSKTQSFSNTVLSLSNLRKYDHQYFIVCIVTPTTNHLLLANSTFLKKVSHSSQALRIDNIKGSFNGSDIMRSFEEITNTPSNFERLFSIHNSIGFEENLPRLVEATNNISPTGTKFEVTPAKETVILAAPERAQNFVKSPHFSTLKEELDLLVDEYRNEILLASLIENVNIRGRIIEYLIAGEYSRLRKEIALALRDKSQTLPEFKTANELGDYHREFPDFVTETDVKTKVITLSSNPKAYNLDKILDFLSNEGSVFLFYFVGIDTTTISSTALVTIFQEDLLDATVMLKQWAGRNSRGVTQLEGKTIESLLESQSSKIDLKRAVQFLQSIIAI